MKIVFDQPSKDLLAVARYTERHNIAKAPVVHLLNCVSMYFGLPGRAFGDDINVPRYHACAKRLFDAIGTDLADFTKEEAIDMMVAAAFWEVPQAERDEDAQYRLTARDAKYQKPVGLVEELRLEAALVPNRRGQLYGLAAERIIRLQKMVRNIYETASEGGNVKAAHGEHMRNLLKECER
jgi:hypothetical protein